VHLHIPTVEESEAGWQMLGGWLPCPSSLLLKCWLRKVKWMCIIALAPEIGVAMAADQFVKAREMNKKFGELHFTLTHCFYALMGGFVIAVPRNRDDNLDQDGITNTTSSENDVDIYPLEGEDFDALKEIGLFPATREGETRGRCLPVVTKEDIRDRSKSDSFTKAFAFIQCTWLVTQCITRVAMGLPLTELELMTLAFIVAALVMYGLWWHKPFDVQRATMLVCPDERARDVRSRLRFRGDLEIRKQWRKNNITYDNIVDFIFGALIAGGEMRFKFDDEASAGLLFAFIGTVISTLHIAAWSWDFPSYTSRILWRVFSVAATCCFPVSYLVLVTAILVAKTLNTYKLLTLLLSILATYIISRLGLIFLIFYCFSSMPAAVYETVNWNTIFPHFS